LLAHRGQYLAAHLTEHRFITPGRLGHQMMERLTNGLDVGRIDASGHRLDALALTGQQETLAVVLQRDLPILVPRSSRQAIPICREALLLWAWRREACSHKTMLNQIVVL
jgi:hypothetical protein